MIEPKVGDIWEWNGSTPSKKGIEYCLVLEVTTPYLGKDAADIEYYEMLVLSLDTGRQKLYSYTEVNQKGWRKVA
jgi:hypothetical protein